MAEEAGSSEYFWFTDADSSKVAEAGDYIMNYLIMLYAVLFLICFCVMLYTLLQREKWSIVKLLKCLLPWPLLARVVDFLTNLNKNYLTQTVSQQNVLNVFTSGACGYLLFSVFLLLVIFWAFLFHKAGDKMGSFVKKMIITYISINVVVYAIWFFLLALMAIFPDKLTTIHQVEGTFAAIIYLLVGLSFFVYGVRLLLALTHNEKINFITRRIFLLTVFCTSTFVLRSLWIIVNEFFFANPLVNLLGATFNDLFFELLPILFILVVLSWPSHTAEFKKMDAERTKFPRLVPV